jgi:hypothetical protein
MSEAELAAFITRILEPEQIARDEGLREAIPFTTTPPDDQVARRLAWEAAATLVAANNRRLTEQLRAWGHQPATPASDDAWTTATEGGLEPTH